MNPNGKFCPLLLCTLSGNFCVYVCIYTYMYAFVAEASFSAFLFALLKSKSSNSWPQMGVGGLSKFQGRKSNPNLNNLVRIFSGGLGFFHVKGWRPKSSVRPSKPGKPKFLGGISRNFARMSRKSPKGLRKKNFVFNFWPLKLFHAQYDWTTGVLDNGHEWRKFRAVPRLYPLRFLVCTFFNKGGSRGAFRLPGAVGDHFHCTVDRAELKVTDLR